MVIIATVGMTAFFRTKMRRDSLIDGQIYSGALFYCLAFTLINDLVEIPMTLLRLPVFYKQRDLRFHPAWAYSLPAWIVKIPLTFVEVGIWVFLTYYVIGFDSNVEGKNDNESLMLIKL